MRRLGMHGCSGLMESGGDEDGEEEVWRGLGRG